MLYNLVFHKKTISDRINLKAAKLENKAKKLCEELSINPEPIHSKQLCGDLQGKRSIRINLQHRLVYEVLEKEKTIKILSMWSHYE